MAACQPPCTMKTDLQLDSVAPHAQSAAAGLTNRKKNKRQGRAAIILREKRRRSIAEPHSERREEGGFSTHTFAVDRRSMRKLSPLRLTETCTASLRRPICSIKVISEALGSGLTEE